MKKVVTCLWFDTQAYEAATFYTSLFGNSRITNVTHYGDAGPGDKGSVLTVSFELDGQELMALNGGPAFKLSEAVSLVVRCEDQAEVDYYWERLTADGGEESMCGWLKDRYGLSWQVVPAALERLMGGPDPAASGRVMEAILKMRRLDIAALEAAYAGSGSDAQ